MRIRAFRRKLDNMKMREKLLISYVIVVFIPVLLVGVILSYNMRQMVVERALKEAVTSIDRTFSRFNESLKVAMDLSYMTRMDENLEKLLLKKYTNVQEILDAYSAYTDFNRYSNLYSVEISSIRFYTHNETIIDNGLFTKITTEIKNYPWFKNAVNAKGKIVWQYTTDEIKNRRSFSLTTVINGSYGNVYLGVMAISISSEYLNNILKNEPYETIICDDYGNIIASSNRALADKKLADTEFADAGNMEDGVWNLNYYNEPVKAVVKNLNVNHQNGKFKIISFVPVNVIEKQTAKIALMGILIMSCSLLLALSFITVFANAISKRVKVLSKEMHQVAMGNFEVVSVLNGGDEIGQLSQDLETMVKSIQNLILEVCEVSNQKNQLAVKQKEIEFKMLANQINPHFLFNVLETLRMHAYIKGDGEMADIIKQLGKIMRRNLEIGNNLVTLKSEIEIIISYLQIQKFRYGNKIEYEINLGHEYDEYLILPLIIQPIVENAIIHGLEFKNGRGKVAVSIRKEDNNIKIIIRDNGIGMDQDRLSYLLQSLDDETEIPERHIGLKNIHQRLKLCYGSGFGLEIRSGKDYGTEVTIFLPDMT